jgi:CubicO group peptidase (beta-lactamase class C family)
MLRLVKSLLPLAITLALAACTTTAPAFEATKLAEIDRTINEAIAEKKLPGAVLWIEHDGAVYRRAYGNRALVPVVEAMTADTVFDAASLTKVIATAPSVWKLIERGKLALDEPAKTYLTEMANGDITIRRLLTHSSGLPASVSTVRTAGPATKKVCGARWRRSR